MQLGPEEEHGFANVRFITLNDVGLMTRNPRVDAGRGFTVTGLLDQALSFLQ